MMPWSPTGIQPAASARMVVTITGRPAPSPVTNVSQCRDAIIGAAMGHVPDQPEIRDVPDPEPEIPESEVEPLVRRFNALYCRDRWRTWVNTYWLGVRTM